MQEHLVCALVIVCLDSFRQSFLLVFEHLPPPILSSSPSPPSSSPNTLPRFFSSSLSSSSQVLHFVSFSLSLLSPRYSIPFLSHTLSIPASISLPQTKLILGYVSCFRTHTHTLSHTYTHTHTHFSW